MKKENISLININSKEDKNSSLYKIKKNKQDRVSTTKIINNAMKNKKTIEESINLVESNNSNFLLERVKEVEAENEKLKLLMLHLLKENEKFHALEQCNHKNQTTNLDDDDAYNLEKIHAEAITKVTTISSTNTEIKENQLKNLMIEISNNKYKIPTVISKTKSKNIKSVKQKPKYSKEANSDSDNDIEVEIDENNLSEESSLISNTTSIKNSKENENSTKNEMTTMKIMKTKNTENKEEDKRSLLDKCNIIDKTKKWNLLPVTDHENFTSYLKLDDEHYPLPQNRPQEKFKKYNPYELFNAYFTDELIQHLVDATNEYMEGFRKKSQYNLNREPRDKKYYDNVTLNEMKVFIAIKVYVNFFHCPRKCGKR